MIELLLVSDPKSRPAAEDISESDHFKALKEENEGLEAANIPKLNIPLFPAPRTGDGNTNEVWLVVSLHGSPS